MAAHLLVMLMRRDGLFTAGLFTAGLMCLLDLARLEKELEITSNSFSKLEIASSTCTGAPSISNWLPLF